MNINIGTGTWIEWTIKTISQNVGNNSSVIEVGGTVKTNGSGWMNYSWTSSQIARIYIDGSRKDSWDVGTQIGPNSSRNLGSRRFTINHNANGAKSVSVKFEYQINANVSGGYKGTVSGTSGYTLKQIPRASRVSVQGLNLPNREIKITTNSPAGGSAQNKLAIYINNAYQAEIVKWGSGTWSWSLTDDKIRGYIKALGYSATYQIKVVCTTIVSGSNIGSATATNNLKNIVKPTLTASKTTYDILNDNSIKLTGSSYAAGMAYTTVTSSPTLGTMSLTENISSTYIEKLVNKYKTLDKINEPVTTVMEVKFNNVTCRTETFKPCSFVASTTEFIESLSHATVSYQSGRDTDSWYPLTLSVVESLKVSARVLSLLRLTVSVPTANAEISGVYVPKSAPVTLQASRLQLERIAETDDGKNDFRYTVDARIYFSLYDLLVFEVETSLLVLKRETYEIDENSTGTFGSIGTKVFTDKWESFSDKLNNLFYSKSPVPQFFYIPIFDRIPSWALENELGDEVKSPLPTKKLFDILIRQAITDPYTETMMYLLCMFEGNRDTTYYKPNNHFKTQISASLKSKNAIQLDSTGFPTIDYTGSDEITITKHYFHTNSGIPTFETSSGIKLAAYIGEYKFDAIEEVRIIPLNIEEYYDPSPAPEPPEIFDGTKSGDMIQPPVFYKKEANGNYTEIKQDFMFYVIDNDPDASYGISMYKYSSTDKTIYYCKQKDALAGIHTASSMHTLDWYTDGKCNMRFSSPMQETFTVRGYAGGILDIRSGDIVRIASNASGSYGLSGDIKDIKQRFYECLYKVQLQTPSSKSSYAYWVIIEGMYKLILAQDIVGTKEYYDMFESGKYPVSSPIYSSVKMLAETPPEYYHWDMNNVVNAIVEEDIQGGIYQCTVGQYTPPKSMEFRQYVASDETVDKVINLSNMDLLVYLKQELPKQDIVVKVVQEDLFNQSSVTLTKRSPIPYVFMDTELRSVGLLKYPTTKNSVEFPK